MGLRGETENHNTHNKENNSSEKQELRWRLARERGTGKVGGSGQESSNSLVAGQRDGVRKSVDGRSGHCQLLPSPARVKQEQGQQPSMMNSSHKDPKMSRFARAQRCPRQAQDEHDPRRRRLCSFLLSALRCSSPSAPFIDILVRMHHVHSAR